MRYNIIYNKHCLKGLKKLPDACIDITNTDPPYNVGKNYGKDKAGEKFIDDKKEDKKYWKEIKEVFTEVFRVTKEGGSLYISHTDHGIFTLKNILEEIGFNFVQMLIWYGRNGYSGHVVTRWVYRTEPILYFCKGENYPILNQQNVGWYTNVLEVSRPQTNFKEGRVHVCQKPVKLYRYILERAPGEVVLDPYIGSGTTAVAALQVGKKYIGFEIIKENVNIAKKRTEGWKQQRRLLSFEEE